MTCHARAYADGIRVDCNGRADRLRIILDVRQASTGRLEGSVRTPGSSVAEPFEGILELVGIIEACLTSPQTGTGVFGVAAENTREPP